MIKIGYIGIYTIILFMTISGFVMHFYETLGLLKETVHTIKEVHEFVFMAVLIFVPLHIIGVVVAEIQDEKGIISDMINGGKI